jgi:hypothetical protein
LLAPTAAFGVGAARFIDISVQASVAYISEISSAELLRRDRLALDERASDIPLDIATAGVDLAQPLSTLFVIPRAFVSANGRNCRSDI